jgi:DNA-binding GntR family transcriptional regulator
MATSRLIKRTLSESVADELREDIRSGAIAPGTRLRQLEVAERFGVSSTPVREAFSLLEREGLVVSTPHRGVLVFHPTVADLRETYEIRIPLEVLATQKAADGLTDADLEALTGIVEQMRAAIADPERYTQLNREFHTRIYAGAGRPKLEKLISDFRDASAAYLRLHTALLPTAAESQADHEEILAGLLARNARQAGKAMERHLQHTVQQVSEGLAKMDAA